MVDDYVGFYIYFGVCEYGMVVCVNGMVFYGGIMFYVVIFLVFVDYCCGFMCLLLLME